MRLTFEQIGKINTSCTLDLSGEVCPIPSLKTRDALNKAKEGELIKVITTSKKSAESIAAEFRDKVYAYSQHDNHVVIILKR